MGALVLMLAMLQAPATVTVFGTVSDSATGEPLRRALVSLFGQQRYFAFTDASGQFQIENVAKGQYSVSTTKPGYFDAENTSPARAMRSVLVDATPQPLVIKLAPAATISGHVMTSAGEPVEGANIQCETAYINNGRLTWNPCPGATTSDDGSYEITNFAPGRYHLRFNQTRVPAFDLPLRAAGPIPCEVYPQQYYPNASDEAGAQILHLEAGAHAEADFTATAVPGFRVSGTATSPEGYFTLSLETPAGTEVGPMSGNANGRWHFDVPAGSWKIVAQTMGGPQLQYYAEQTVDIRGSDISNVNLVFQPLPGIPVRVSDPDNSETRYVQIRLDSWKSVYFSNATAEGSPVSIQNVPPGSYRVSVSVPGNNTCIDTVTSGNSDLSRNNLVVSAGANPAPIEVTLRSDCASLDIAIDAAETRAASVLLVPDNRLIEPGVQYTSSGKAQFRNVSPGQYTVYAFSSIDDLEYANPEALRNYSGESITLEPNQHAELKIALIQRSGQ